MFPPSGNNMTRLEFHKKVLERVIDMLSGERVGLNVRTMPSADKDEVFSSGMWSTADKNGPVPQTPRPNTMSGMKPVLLVQNTGTKLCCSS